MESKQEPSFTATKEKPPLLSRRVRTQPLTVTCSPTATFPLSASEIETLAIGKILREAEHPSRLPSRNQTLAATCPAAPPPVQYPPCYESYSHRFCCWQQARSPVPTIIRSGLAPSVTTC